MKLENGKNTENVSLMLQNSLTPQNFETIQNSPKRFHNALKHLQSLRNTTELSQILQNFPKRFKALPESQKIPHTLLNFQTHQAIPKCSETPEKATKPFLNFWTLQNSPKPFKTLIRTPNFSQTFGRASERWESLEC